MTGRSGDVEASSRGYGHQPPPVRRPNCDSCRQRHPWRHRGPVMGPVTKTGPHTSRRQPHPEVRAPRCAATSLHISAIRRTTRAPSNELKVDALRLTLRQRHGPMSCAAHAPAPPLRLAQFIQIDRGPDIVNRCPQLSKHARGVFAYREHDPDTTHQSKCHFELFLCSMLRNSVSPHGGFRSWWVEEASSKRTWDHNRERNHRY